MKDNHPDQFYGKPSSSTAQQLTLKAAFSRTFTQGTFEEKLIKFQVAANLPFHVVEIPEFEDFVNYLNPAAKWMGEKTLASRLASTYATLKAEKIKEIAAVKAKISFTSDTWTALNSDQFDVITASYITEDWILKAELLDFVPLKGSHTGTRLCEAFTEVVRDTFQITNKRHGAVTLDNASNNTNMMCQYCEKHALDADIHSGCAAHAINLAVKLVVGVFVDSISRLRAYIKFIRASPNLILRFEALFERANGTKDGCLSLPLDCVTRWGSTLHMLKTVVENDKMLRTFKVS